MTKIVYNACHGGFSLSETAVRMLSDRKGRHIGNYPNDRTDPDLVAVVEELGDAANGSCAELRIVELPEGTRYRITEYDGLEDVETPDDIEWSIA